MSEQSTPKVNWQSIIAMPLISSMIDGLLDEVERPHVLDDYTVGRIIKVCISVLRFARIAAF